MISKACSIEAFVEAVKDAEVHQVIRMAVEEATSADRLILKARKTSDMEGVRYYSTQLKQLIDYHRFAVKPQRPDSQAYRLYMAHWGNRDQ